MDVYRQVIKAAPLYQEAYALGLQAAKRADDVDGIRWATVGILKQAWPANQEAVRNAALRIAKATLDELKAKGDQAAFDAYQAELDAALVRDCVVKVTWNGDADVDLIVEEPAARPARSASRAPLRGGVWLGDSYAGSDDGAGGRLQRNLHLPARLCRRVPRANPQGVGRARRRPRDRGRLQKLPRSKRAARAPAHRRWRRRRRGGVQPGTGTPHRSARSSSSLLWRWAISRPTSAVLAQQLDSLDDDAIIPGRNNLDPINLRRRSGAGPGRRPVGFMPVITVPEAARRCLAFGGRVGRSAVRAHLGAASLHGHRQRDDVHLRRSPVNRWTMAAEHGGAAEVAAAN